MGTGDDVTTTRRATTTAARRGGGGGGSGRTTRGVGWALQELLLLRGGPKAAAHRKARALVVLLLLLTALIAILALAPRKLGIIASSKGDGAFSSSLLALAPRFQQEQQEQQHAQPRRASLPSLPPPPSDFEPFANLTPLPAFTAPVTADGAHTAYVLGATLTRDARLGSQEAAAKAKQGRAKGKEEYDEEAEAEALLVDVFFMGVSSMTGGTTYSGVDRDPSASPAWQAAMTGLTRNVRQRAVEDGFAYECRFQLAHAWAGEGAADEPVKAIVVPTATTVDGNVNDMVNILRCPLPAPVAAFCRRHRRGELQVALFERAPGPDASASSSAPQPLLNFTLPIAARSAGFLAPHTPLPTPADADADADADGQESRGGLDPWAKLWDARTTPPQESGQLPLSPQRNRSVALCVAGVRSAFASPLAELTVEWLEHHLLQGVGTVVFGADYDVGSKDWRRMARVLRPYIEEGRVVMSSTRAVGGREVHSELKKVYHYNQCLYWAKGLAEWVGVWDVDEFLTPRTGPTDSLLAVLDRHADPTTNEGRDVGFLLFTSYSHALPLAEAAALEANASVHLPLNDRDDAIHWVGQRFAQTRESGHDDMYQKSLLSARHIYFTGYHLPGACTARADPEGDWGRLLRDDDPEWEFYARKVAKEEAASFHYRVVVKPITYVRSKVWEASEYSLFFFDRVLARIQRRGLERLLVDFKTLHALCSEERARLALE